MSIYNALYGRDGHGVGPNEPEKKGFARFCQMVGRDLGQLLGTNLMVCVLCLRCAGVSLGVTLLSLPITVVCSAVTGLLTGPAWCCWQTVPAQLAERPLSVAAPGKADPSRPLESRLRLWLHWHAGAGAAVLCIGLCV